MNLTQLTLFDTLKEEEVLRTLKTLEVDTLSPKEALDTIYRLQNKLLE
jgi:DNA mismatch repair protein MutS